MQTKLIPLYQESDTGKEAESILRNCVHCGFCNATCPTYQVLGDELDGPRGRIYLIKDMLEGKPVSEETRQHLDRCLTCRACETTCPSGVEYHRLLDIGREILDDKIPRSYPDNMTRKVLAQLLSSPVLFKTLLKFGQRVRPMLPLKIQAKVPFRQPATLPVFKQSIQRRKVLVLDGCVQDSLAPNINLATRYVLAKFGVECISIESAVCCGSAAFHLNEFKKAKQQAKVNIDAWWPIVDAGECEAIIVNASGCGVFVKDYGSLLKDDEHYRQRAKTIAGLARDPSEFLVDEDWARVDFPEPSSDKKIVFHPPCTLQHGQKITGQVEKILAGLGAEVLGFKDTHLCCGSAGTYSILQSEISSELKSRKVDAIEKVKPEQILTANIGCQSHLASGTTIPVRHWLEFVAEMFGC